MSQSLFSQVWQELHLQYPFLVSVFLLSLVLLFINRCGFSVSKKLKLPPSPRKLPLIGNLHQLGSLPHHSLRSLSSKHGPLMLLHLGQVPIVVVSSANMVREMTKSHDIAFSNRPKSTASDIFLYAGEDMGYAPYGEFWRQTRKICVLELLSLKRVHEFQFVRDSEVQNLLNRIRKASQNRAVSINLSEMLIATANNIVSRILLGKCCAEEDGNSRFGEIAREMSVQMLEFSVGDFFPSLSWIDHLRGFIRKLKATFGELDEFFDQVIEEHKAAFRRNGNRSEMKDFVDILLQLKKDDMLGFELTHVNLKALLLDLFVAGTETTSTTLEWLMAELIKNPKVMEKAQEEVRRVVGKKPKIDMDDINRMEYLKCVIKEIFRLHPAAPLLLPRETSANVEMGGYHIPSKTTVLINAWAIQRDPKSWDRPEEFIPERFQNSSVDFKGQDFQFIPFGIGRRGCPGIAFAVASTEYAIANLLYWFDWKLPAGAGSGENIDMAEVYGVTVHKKVPLHLVPTPFCPSP